MRFPLGDVAFEQVPQRDGSVLLRPGVADAVTVRDLAGNQRLIWSAESGGSSSSSASSDSEGDLNGWVDMPDFDIVYADGTRKQVRLTQPGYFNVFSYGALGNGIADDKAAIQAALDAAGLVGGTVLFPAGVYNVSSRLSLDDVKGVTLRGLGGRATFASPSNLAELVYTGATGGGLLSMASAEGILAENLWFTWTDTTYADKLISTDHSATGGDSSYITFRGCRFGQKGGSSVGAADMAHLKRCIVVSFYDCVFARGGRAIVGRDPSTTYSNVIGVYNCTFNKTTDYPIWNPGESWTIIGNSFEPRNDGSAGAVGTSGDNFCIGFHYAGNWHGDVSATGGNWIDALKPLGAFIGGNRFADPGSGQACVSFATSGADGITIAGNRMDGGSAIGINFPGSVSRCVVSGNDFQIGTQIVGATNVTGGLDVLGGATITVTSAATIDLAPTSKIFQITGSTTITAITGGWQGRIVYLRFSAGVTVTNGANLKLAGGVNFSATADDVLGLWSDGTTWREVSRSVN